MSVIRFQEWPGAVKLLSLLLAGLLWLCMILERTDQLTVKVPVRPEYLPVGLRLESPPPERLEVTISGPRILLCRLLLGGVSCGLDLTQAAAGTAEFVPGEDSFRLERELKVVRVNPATVSLTLAREGQRR